MTDREWMTGAICRGLNPETWFPEHPTFPGSQALTRGQIIALAKRVCDSCPVRKECREYALETNSEYGVWGALTAPERRRLTGRGRRYRRAG